MAHLSNAVHELVSEVGGGARVDFVPVGPARLGGARLSNGGWRHVAVLDAVDEGKPDQSNADVSCNEFHKSKLSFASNQSEVALWKCMPHASIILPSHSEGPCWQVNSHSTMGTVEKV